VLLTARGGIVELRAGQIDLVCDGQAILATRPDRSTDCGHRGNNPPQKASVEFLRRNFLPCELGDFLHQDTNLVLGLLKE